MSNVPLSSLTDAESASLLGLALHEELDPSDYVVHRSTVDGAAYTVDLDGDEVRLTPGPTHRVIDLPEPIEPDEPDFDADYEADRAADRYERDVLGRDFREDG